MGLTREVLINKHVRLPQANKISSTKLVGGKNYLNSNTSDQKPS